MTRTNCGEDFVVFRGDTIVGLRMTTWECGEIIKDLDITNLKEGVNGLGNRTITIWHRGPDWENQIRFIEACSRSFRAALNTSSTTLDEWEVERRV